MDDSDSDDGFLSLALQLQERWVGSHEVGASGLSSRDHFDDARFDRVLASIWEKRVALEAETSVPSAPVMAPHSSAGSLRYLLFRDKDS
jgi:hypothetical protein